MAGSGFFEVPDDTSGVLTCLREEREAEDAAAAHKLQLVVAWASMHSSDTLVGPM